MNKKMSDFFDNYLNISKIMCEKREYREQMARVEALPQEYKYLFKKIQSHMWQFAAGSGYDMMKVHYDLLDLFEAGAAEGRHVLDITGEDVAAFCDELLRGTETYTENWRLRFNREIQKHFGRAGDDK